MASLSIHPCKRLPPPGYPMRLDAQINPDLLKKHFPLAWLRRPQIAFTAGTLLVGSLSCTTPFGNDITEFPPVAGHAVVAPLFGHGEGRGSVGCVSVSPPVFLSEEEALQIITEELAKYGVQLTQNNVTWSDAGIPQRQELDSGQYTLTGDTKPLVVDRLDPNRHIAVEFVGTAEFQDNGGPIPNASVQTLDLKETAKWVDAQVQQKGPEAMYFAAFYDPVTNVEAASWESYERKLPLAVQESKEHLRQQVQDFANWLQAQGVF
jgi:hypothetical protein